MAMYRTVSMSFWTDSKVIDDFTPEDKYFYLYLFTNPHTNLAGCFEISMKQIVAETGYSKETIENLLKRFEEVHNVLRYSSSTKEILLLNWHKYNWTSSEKFRKPLLKQLQDIKNESFKEYLMRLYNGDESCTYGIDTNCIDATVTVTDTVTNTVTNNITVKPARNLIPPTLEMVQDYIREKGYNVDAEQFMDYYNSKGWVVGKTKMKDWQASVRTWSRNGYNKQPANPFAEMLRKGDY